MYAYVIDMMQMDCDAFLLLDCLYACICVRVYAFHVLVFVEMECMRVCLCKNLCQYVCMHVRMYP